jgi:hypothetical protein
LQDANVPVLRIRFTKPVPSQSGHDVPERGTMSPAQRLGAVRDQNGLNTVDQIKAADASPFTFTRDEVPNLK